jgi:hypothetical protein
MSLHNVCLIMSFQFYPTFWCLPGNKPNKHQETEITPRHSCGQLWSEQLSFQTTFESIHAHGPCGSRMLWVKTMCPCSGHIPNVLSEESFSECEKTYQDCAKKWVCPSTPHRCFGSVHLQVSHTGSLIRKRMIFWKTSIRYQEKAGSYHTHFAVHPHLRSTLTQEDLQKFDETGSSYSSKQICSNGIPPKSVLNWDFPIFSYINIYYTPKSIFPWDFPIFSP